MIFSIRVILHKDRDEKQPDGTHEVGSQNPIIQDLVLSIDSSGRITKFNEECERIFGYKKNEVLDKCVTDFFVPNRHLNQWNYMLENSKINKQVDNLKIPFLTKSGEEIIVSWSNFPVKNENGNVVDIGLVGALAGPAAKSDETIFEYPKPYEKINIDNIAAAKEKIKIDDYITKVFRKIKDENEDLLIKNRELENKLKEYQDYSEQNNNKKINYELKNSYPAKNARSFSKLFVGKKKIQEFENIERKLAERKKFLDEKESKLLDEKIKINEQLNDFIVWREKLELLNNRLEEKWNEIKTRENLIPKKSLYENNLEDIAEIKSHQSQDDFELFDKIQDSAVIIQRGILRHANRSFVDLVGYNLDEIIDKSLFDFIGLEGFSNIEKFYLDRLKGEDVSAYESILLTKNNDKINIKVFNKPTFFKGGKAEIAVFKILKKD